MWFSPKVLLHVPACEDHVGKGHLTALTHLSRVHVARAKTHCGVPRAPTPPARQHTATAKQLTEPQN